MSAIIKTAIFSILTGDATLNALIGQDENGDPAVFNASYNELGNPPFPCITFREADGSADGRFRETTIDTEYYDIEIWAQSESALTIPNIHARVDALLHNQAVTASSGTVYDCVRVTQIPDQYDKALKLHFGLYRYRLVVSR